MFKVKVLLAIFIMVYSSFLSTLVKATVVPHPQVNPVAASTAENVIMEILEGVESGYRYRPYYPHYNYDDHHHGHHDDHHNHYDDHHHHYDGHHHHYDDHHHHYDDHHHHYDDHHHHHDDYHHHG